MTTPILAIHGGIGTITRTVMNADREAAYQQTPNDIPAAGQRILVEDGSALDAVAKVARLLEECPLFNADKGAVLTSTGTHELGASIMNGTTLVAGAVTCVKCLCSPILTAHMVIERSEHMSFTSEDAEVFAQAQGLEFIEPSYHHIEARYARWQRARQQEGMVLLDHGTVSLVAKEAAPIDPDNKFSIVGTVTRDIQGRLTAATSTGGVTSKKVGCVGNTSIVGAGCFVNDIAAVLYTGMGEMSIHAVVAYDIVAQMECVGESLADASNDVVMRRSVVISGRGGLIAVDAQGNVALSFNTEEICRGFARGV